ncbi:hypothetical protein BGZ61DRAFT_438395 [Ilyonectria robusta]|uniref:uncharacterized protein n=1 Tax=Ilyonectria robusta TaxID=1079257 RepID=UPI001E8DCE88|nr:uncharacterized protein BGZ61DRAFT_438395 [Ilyonectria robusta]KAH8737477.1 hypothetical protein BGZ61DRAFT_438395 [Ilyonectria robusta]
MLVIFLFLYVGSLASQGRSARGETISCLWRWPSRTHETRGLRGRSELESDKSPRQKGRMDQGRPRQEETQARERR